MCLKPTTEMAEPHAEGELQDQLADLEAQLQQIDDALEATGGADPELKTASMRRSCRAVPGALMECYYYAAWGAGARRAPRVCRGVPGRTAAGDGLSGR